MLKNIAIVCLSLLTLASCSEQPGMRLVFTGDVMLDRGVDDRLRLFGDSLLAHSFESINDHDFLIINYEGTFTRTGVSQADRYNFKADESRARILQNAGVTHVSVANNHVYDFGSTGYENTLKALSKNQLIPLGETCNPKILHKGKYSCAVLAASLAANNDSLCISLIGKLKQSIHNHQLRNLSMPLIVFIHWGLELQPTPEKYQKNLAKELIEAGADAIIGHHPHVTQTVEFINNAPVFYSIGNYIADAYLPDTDESYTVELTITHNIEKIEIKPFKIEDYFPCSIHPDHQTGYIKDFLSYSTGICAMPSAGSWTIKPIAKVNFQEDTDLWLFAEDETMAAVKKLRSGTHLLKLFTPFDTSNTIHLHGSLSEMHIADINHDGNQDVLLGISKKVHFDPVIKKRIQIYTYQNKNLQPLWLGTKFVHDVEQFEITQRNQSNYLQTVEINEQGKRYQGIYEWDQFGFALLNLKQIKSDENF